MGQDKALLSIDGIPLLVRVCSVATSCGAQTTIVTPWPERYRHLPLAADFVPEPPPTGETAGPLAGFAQGLRVATTEWVLLLACDLPRLQVPVLRAGMAELPHLPADCSAFLHRHAKGWEPLCGFYRQHCLSSIEAFLQVGDGSFQTWLAGESVCEWQTAPAEMFFNCNTPVDCEEI
jgi:molybdopterin-guanine dinucleotide biosynthesis protein A